MKFDFPIIIVDQDFRVDNISGSGMRALAEAIEARQRASSLGNEAGCTKEARRAAKGQEPRKLDSVLAGSCQSA